jgi:nucleoside-diphosphate-sugar epimerase
MHVLVTGADGFIGGHVTTGLRAAGYTVTGAVFARPPQSEEVRVDLTRSAELQALPQAVDAVVHAAGIVDPAVSSAAMFAVNLEATRHVVAWARERAVRHFVLLSSVAVYGPLLLGEDRDERTHRLGLAVGLPYMRSKARAERVVERSGLPFTLLRPPAVLGHGDLLSRAFAQRLAGPGLPLVPGARPERRVALSFVAGLALIVRRLLEHGALNRPVHAVDAELTLADLAAVYARALRRPCSFAPLPWSEAIRRRTDAGFSWLVASARFGQHYSARHLLETLAYTPPITLAQAVDLAVSGLRGNTPALS